MSSTTHPQPTNAIPLRRSQLRDWRHMVLTDAAVKTLHRYRTIELDNNIMGEQEAFRIFLYA